MRTTVILCPLYSRILAYFRERLRLYKKASMMYRRKELMDVYSFDNKTAWLRPVFLGVLRAFHKMAGVPSDFCCNL